MTKKIEVFASEALPGELEDFPDIKRGWGTTKESTGGIPPMKWFNAIQKRTDEVINEIIDGLPDLNNNDGSGKVGFSHDLLYLPATVGHKLKNSVWVTDAPFNAKMDGVTDDTDAFQKAVNSGKIVQIPSGNTVVSNLTIYPNTTIIGCGRRHGVYVTSGTQILYKGDKNSDWLTLKDRDGMVGDGQGGVTLKSFSCINASDYLELPDEKTEPYYLYRPNPNMVLNGNSRALFGVNKSKVNWGGFSEWQKPKSNGVDCPFLIIDDVKLQNFTYPIDVNTWMCEISNFETYMSGPIRVHGTSTKFKSCWPRYPLSCAYQLSIQYSSITSSSLGENVYKEKDGGGVELHGGELSITNCGYENIRNTVISCFGGTVYVDMLTGVTSATNRPGRLGRIMADDAFIYWGTIPKVKFTSGEQVRFSWELITANSESRLKNHIFNTPIPCDNNFIEKPWEPKGSKYGDNEFISPYASQTSGNLIGSPFVVFPATENRLREVNSMKVGYNNSVLIRGAGKLFKFAIHGGFKDGVTSASSVNPRQKHGMLTIDFISYSSPMADGVSSAINKFKTDRVIVTFSSTLEGRVYDIIYGDNSSQDGSKPLTLKVEQIDDAGLMVSFGISKVNDGSDLFRQCVANISYCGSYPNNKDNKTVELITS